MAIFKAVGTGDKTALGRLIPYVLNDEKVEAFNVLGIGLDTRDALAQMRRVRKIHGDPGGLACYHHEVSFPPGEVSGWQALDIAKQIVERCPEYSGHQILMAAHTDQEHAHVHIVINAVHTETGRKFQFGPPSLRHAKQVCNEITRELGLSVPVKGKTFDGRDREEPTAWTRKTYEVLQEGERVAAENDREPEAARRTEQPSYIRAIGDAAVAALAKATSREEFIALLDEAGIDVAWTDKRKHVTLTDRARVEAGEKKCKIRLATLNDHYNLISVPEGTEDAAVFLKTELENEFKANAGRAAERERYERGKERADGAAESARTAVRESEVARGESELTRRIAETEISGSRSDEGATNRALSESRIAIHEPEPARAAESGRTDEAARTGEHPGRNKPVESPGAVSISEKTDGVASQNVREPASGGYAAAVLRDPESSGSELSERAAASPVGREDWHEQIKGSLARGFERVRAAARSRLRKLRDGISELSERISGWYEKIAERCRQTTGEIRSEISESVSQVRGQSDREVPEAVAGENIATRITTRRIGVVTRLRTIPSRIAGSLQDRIRDYRADAGEWEPQRGEREVAADELESTVGVVRDRVGSEIGRARDVQPAPGERKESGEERTLEKNASSDWRPNREDVARALSREYASIYTLAPRNPVLREKLTYVGSAYEMKLREVGRVRIESDRTIWRQTGIFGRIKAKGARGDYIDLLTRELPEFADMSRADALIESAKRYHPDLYDEVVATLIKEREEAQKKTALEKAKKAAAIEAEAAKARLPQKETSAVAVPESKRSRILSPEEIRYEKNVERGKARLRTQEGTRRLIELAAAYSYSGWNLIAMAGAESETAMLVALPRMGEDGKFHLEFSAPQPSPGPRLNITHADFDEVMRRIRFRGSYGGERGLQTAKLSELMARVALGESPRHDDSLMREVAEHPMIIDAARSDLFEAREDLERERERKASLPPRTPEKQIEEARGPERWRGRER